MSPLRFAPRPLSLRPPRRTPLWLSRDRGSVMILVVAVLGLLAVLGTVYIVSSRTQRASSAAMNADLNFSLARQAILSQVQQVIGDAMVDSTGSIGGVGHASPRLASRNYDYPELAAGATGATSYNAAMRAQPWLVAHMHNQSLAVNDLTLLTPTPFNPSTGGYSGIPNTLFPYDPTVGALSTIVGDQTPLASETTTEDPPTTTSDAYINVLPFSDITGVRYRYGGRILDTSRMANINVGANDDALAKSDTLGQYLTSLRLAPAVADMDYTKNTYFNYGTGTSGDGVSVNPGSIDMKTALQQSQPPTTSGLGRAGFSAANATFSLAGWQQQILRIESPTDTLLSLFDATDELDLHAYGDYGTNFHVRAANISTNAASNTFRLWPYTFSVAANAAGNFSPTGGSQIGNPRRRNYTAYSFSRAISPYADPKTLAGTFDYALALVAGANDALYQQQPSGFTVDANFISVVYPARLQQVNVNFPVSFSSATVANDSLFYLGATASNMATLMQYGVSPPPVAPSVATNNVYTQDETTAYAANSITFRANGMTKDTTIVSPPAAGAWYLPYGPSFIDDQGICVRTANTVAAVTQVYGRDFGPSSDSTKPSLNSGATNRIYLGYAAQPFLNEIAAQEGADNSTGTPVPVFKDVAFELHNPYPTALSLQGYHLKVLPTAAATATVDIDLTGQYVPAYGYLVITTNGSPEFAGKVTANPVGTPPVTVFAPTALTPTSLDPAVGGVIILYRPYFRRGNLATALTSADLAPVDQMSYSPFTDATGLPDLASQPATDYSIGRGNSAATGVGQWGAAIDSALTRVSGQTLGKPNANGGSGYPLYDRYANNSGLAQGSQFTNLNEFNQIMRVAHVFDITTPANPTVVSLIPQKLAGLAASTAPYSNMQFPIDAQLHFDFFAAPWIYNTTPTADPASPPTAAYKPGDIRAVHLLDQITLLDRVSDVSINVGTTNAIDKLRLPGQININTAYGDVIRALPAIQAITSVTPNAAVANILCYRDRLSTADTRAKYPLTATGTASTVDYSDITKYPGKGFRSLAELLVVLASPTATDLQSRDKDWAAMLTLCTVRSDTFIVYGYMEAVRANPAFNTTFDNAAHWYGAVTDDPRDANIATIPLLRIAQRRWVALIDRSFCNYDRSSGSFTLPKVVAIKDLPQ